MSASFDAYKIFYFVGRYKNITKTANALFLSQSTVSRCIQNLEAELGCRLFERSQSGVALTEKGELMYNHVSRACEHIFFGEEKLRQMQSGVRSLRLNVSEFFLWQFLVPVLDRFHQAHPDVCVEVSTHTLGTQKEAMDELSSGLTDLVCTMAPVSSASGAVISELCSFQDVLIAGPGFRELRDRPYSLSELVRYPFAALVTRESGPNFYNKLFAMRGLDVTPAFKVDTASLLLPLVRRSLGLAFIPAPFLSQFTAEDGIFQVRILDQVPTQSVCVAVMEPEEQPPILLDMIGRIREYARTQRAYDKLPG